MAVVSVMKSSKCSKLMALSGKYGDGDGNGEIYIGNDISIKTMDMDFEEWLDLLFLFELSAVIQKVMVMVNKMGGGGWRRFIASIDEGMYPISIFYPSPSPSPSPSPLPIFSGNVYILISVNDRAITLNENVWNGDGDGDGDFVNEIEIVTHVFVDDGEENENANANANHDDDCELVAAIDNNHHHHHHHLHDDVLSGNVIENENEIANYDDDDENEFFPWTAHGFLHLHLHLHPHPHLHLHPHLHHHVSTFPPVVFATSSTHSSAVSFRVCVRVSPLYSTSSSSSFSFDLLVFHHHHHQQDLWLGDGHLLVQESMRE